MGFTGVKQKPTYRLIGIITTHLHWVMGPTLQGEGFLRDRGTIQVYLLLEVNMKTLKIMLT